MNKALFLDRDGVLDDLVFHGDTNGWEAPRNENEVTVRPDAREALQQAAADGWLIFVVSNQPDVAKGRTTMDALNAAHRRVVELLGNPPITEFLYCFHRAEDGCACRKPQPGQVIEAAKKYDVDLRRSWFIGDVDTDIECGRRAGTRTALVEYAPSADKRGKQRADLVSRDLGHAIRELTARKSEHGSQSED